MPFVADNVADLGIPSQDGATGKIRTTHNELPLRWNEANQVWLSDPFVTMRINEHIGISVTGNPSDWRYPGVLIEVPVPTVNPTHNRFFIHKVPHGGELWESGLRLQEHLSGEMAQFGTAQGDVDSAVALAWYPLADGDEFLSPEPFNIGVQLIRDKDDDPTRYRWCSSSWQNNVTIGVGSTMGEPNQAPGATHHLYPEIYGFGCEFNLRKFTALHRWVGGEDLGPSGPPGTPTKFPPFTGSGDANRNVRGWYRADNIGVTVGSQVASWSDYSGYGRDFRQPTSSKRPILTVSDLGSHRFLRFDGTDDIMGNHLTDRPTEGPEYGQPSPVSLNQPYSFSMVIRQRATGGTQQVWASQNGSGAPLIYRSAGAGEVNTWIGTEPTIDVGSWPSGWLIYSLRVNSDNTYAIRINGSEVATGSGATAYFNGVLLGNNEALTLPGAVDIAEVLYTFGDMTQSEQAALVTYLNSYYSIF